MTLGATCPGHHTTKRHVQHFVVKGVAVEHAAVVEELLTVVRRHDEHHIPGVSPTQFVHEPTQLCIVVSEARRVPLANPLLVPRRYLQLARANRCQSFGPPIHRRRVVADESTRERSGRGVRVVRIEGMEVEEERLVAVLSIEPAQGRCVDSLGTVVDRCLNAVSLLRGASGTSSICPKPLVIPKPGETWELDEIDAVTKSAPAKISARVVGPSAASRRPSRKP